MTSSLMAPQYIMPLNSEQFYSYPCYPCIPGTLRRIGAPWVRGTRETSQDKGAGAKRTAALQNDTCPSQFNEIPRRMYVGTSRSSP
jgi:hypothetical protein